MKEEWKTVRLRNGKQNKWYSISNHGNLVSHFKNKSMGNLGFDRSYDPVSRRKIKFSTKINKTSGSVKCLYVKLTCPPDLFENYNYFVSSNSTNILKEVFAHQLVMWTFKPMDTHPPDRLEPYWNDIPEPVKLWIKDCSLINHIDHDPTNNHIDNLEWATPEENSHKAVKFYGGNVANKGKITSLIDTPFYLNPLASILENA